MIIVTVQSNLPTIKSFSLNLFVYLLTLVLTCLYIVRNQSKINLITGSVLMLALLVFFLARHRFQMRFVKNISIFVAFWMILYVALPSGINPIYGVTSLVRNSFSVIQSFLVLPEFLIWRYLLLVAVIAMLALQGVVKKESVSEDESGTGLTLLYYLATIVVVTLLSLALVKLTFSLNLNDNRAWVKGYLLLAGLFLIFGFKDCRYRAKIPRVSQFITASLVYTLIPCLYGTSALTAVKGILVLGDFWAICMGMIAVLGTLLLLEEPDDEEPDDTETESRQESFAFSIYAWCVYSIIAHTWIRYMNWYVLAFGVPLAFLIYEYMERYRKENYKSSKIGLTFVFWIATILGLMALSRILTVHIQYLLLVATLLLGRFICIKISDDQGLILNCFRGIACMLLLVGTRLNPLLSPTMDSSIVFGLIFTGVLWCILCVSLGKADAKLSHIFENEYFWVKNVQRYIPHGMAAATLLLLLFQ